MRESTQGTHLGADLCACVKLVKGLSEKVPTVRTTASLTARPGVPGWYPSQDRRPVARTRCPEHIRGSPRRPVMRISVTECLDQHERRMRVSMLAAT